MITGTSKAEASMKIGMITDSVATLDFDAMLALAARLGMDALEFACGNWSPAPHITNTGSRSAP
jgi:sugar phosphate isomerase/epimerase